MADKEVNNDANEPKAPKVTPEKMVQERPGTDVKNAGAAHDGPAATAANKKRTFVIVLIGGIIVLYIAAIMIGLTIYKAVEDRRSNMYGGTSTMHQLNGTPRFNGEQTYTVRHSTSDGLTTTTTNQTFTQTQGVVTAVSGDSITVAGGGKTQVIKTNGDTTYMDNEKPAVNDTVVIVGTKDGDTITATEIRVYTYDD
jgi:hypothetical protein